MKWGINVFKELTTIITAALMFIYANSAFAAFANFDLIRVVSDKTPGSTLEIATDLGNINTLAAMSNTIVGGGSDAFTNFNTNPLANLSVNYFAVNRTSVLNGTMWIGTNTLTAPITGGMSAIQNYYSITSNNLTPSVNKYYSSLSLVGASTVIANNSNVSSLSRVNGRNTLGSYRGYTDNWSSNANLSLANLATTPFNISVWMFGDPAGYQMANPITGVKVLDLTTNADGSTTINPTPIPPAFLLMGSGLIGIFGLMRKKHNNN
jgi:hypothetical protein